MKVVVVGTRGIPDIQGGVETHCQELYPRLSKLGCDITVVTRKPYVSANKRKSCYGNITLKHIYAPKVKSLEAIIHTFLGIVYARLHQAEILHVHAIGPALLIPFARILGLQVVLTHHGPDYDRKKWGVIAKLILRAGEALGIIFANEIIVISRVIDSNVRKKYGRYNSNLIYNGVTISTQDNMPTEYIDKLGLEKKKYVIAVGRFVEEKGFHDLIKAWKEVGQSTFKLVLVGDADHETKYSIKLKEQAKSNGVILTGFIKGEVLTQVFLNAKLFVMPSYHEGLPIALLEALSYNLDILVSDIPANKEIPLSEECFFKVGDISEMADKIGIKLHDNRESVDYSQLLAEKYNWDVVAKKTFNVYKVLNKHTSVV